tara:strand:+ start:450 stop:599 length:150 start_codon:yes stop_codon:yes gene_type:complete
MASVLVVAEELDMSDAPDMPDTPEDVPDMLGVSEGSEDSGALLNSMKNQ